QGVAHRDLKPANILLSDSGTVPATHDISGWGSQAGLASATLKITDFGLAKLLLVEGQGLTQTNEVLGTPSYMAPEQTTGKTSPAVDVYALGAILYQLLTGRPPFLADTPWATILQVQHEEPVSPSRLQSATPRDLVTICLKCLHKEPHKRYASARALADDLRRFLEGKPILARPVGTLERAAKWVRRRPALAAALVALVVVAALGLAGVVWQFRQTVAALTETEQARDDSRRAHDATKVQLYVNQVGLTQQQLQANHASRAERLL